MGNQSSSRSQGGVNNNNNNNNSSSSSSNNCQQCFVFDGLLRRVTGRITDPIGTPLPDTPIQTRRRREELQHTMQDQKNKNDPIYSSQYLGLEKERFLPPGSDGNNKYISSGSSSDDENDDVAQIHEGPQSEAQLLAKYQLLEVLGVGSTSTVHRCLCKRNQQYYACKIIDVTLMEERFQGMMEQFQTEITALKQLQHPSIIGLYDVYITSDKIFIVMELMSGGELFDYVVTKGTLTEDEAAQLVRKVTSALVYMHEKNIVHRDLKPENLLLRRKPASPHEDIDIKIIDFGLSKAMEEPVARTFLGTRGYLAPEMLQRRDYTRAVDTWALGVIVFVLLCGCLPFDDDSAHVPSDDLVKTKFVLRFPRWAKNVSASAKDLLSHLLDVNPQTRYTADQALAHPWVQGRTAPKGNLLASPGKIRQSPGVRNVRNNNGTSAKLAGRKFAPPPGTKLTSPGTTTGPAGPMARKTSL